VRRTGPETPDRLQWGSPAPGFFAGAPRLFLLLLPEAPLHPSCIDLPHTYLLCYFFWGASLLLQLVVRVTPCCSAVTPSCLALRAPTPTTAADDVPHACPTMPAATTQHACLRSTAVLLLVACIQLDPQQFGSSIHLDPKQLIGNVYLSVD
jgi:hypothetical protein